LIVRHAVLAVRLLANMFGGHLVLAVILSFIISTAKLMVLAWFGVTLASVVGSAAMTLLEMFVAFMQAYVFTFLSALFIGMAVHPH
jgi:F-type H+-transporting ATPase subunit a